MGAYHCLGAYLGAYHYLSGCVPIPNLQSPISNLGGKDRRATLYGWERQTSLYRQKLDKEGYLRRYEFMISLNQALIDHEHSRD
uniref:Uncharacterized protein n=2 Tax=Picea TaxID=3328 RepID=A0A101LY06_PICGL|nr:hypothetical protein ABT39_MTgene5463 [Picea glauca]QHR91525.1 hypothetical protein Q903MT_gene5560 [Picea sitchensis]